MGIPRYFSYLIRNCPGLLDGVSAFVAARPDLLCLDSNSLVYDCHRALLEERPELARDWPALEAALVAATLDAIERVLRMAPAREVLVAFDGAAPFPKVQQQVRRRSRGLFEKQGAAQSTGDWPLTRITAGEPFMDRLSAAVYARFADRPHVRCDCADRPGEGEQKIFAHLRAHPVPGRVALYGLDADLIMLSLLHLRRCASIHIFREAPDFLRSRIEVAAGMAGEPAYRLDVGRLAERIPRALGRRPNGPQDRHRAVADYVALCFLLGNDFLPRLMAANIHASGLERLFEAYRAARGHLLTADARLDWAVFGRIFRRLADQEQDALREELARDRRFRGRPADPRREPDHYAPARAALQEFVAPDHPGWRERFAAVMGDRPGYKRRLLWVLDYYVGRDPGGHYQTMNEAVLASQVLCEPDPDPRVLPLLPRDDGPLRRLLDSDHPVAPVNGLAPLPLTSGPPLAFPVHQPHLIDP